MARRHVADWDERKRKILIKDVRLLLFRLEQTWRGKRIDDVLRENSTLIREIKQTIADLTVFRQRSFLDQLESDPRDDD